MTSNLEYLLSYHLHVGSSEHNLCENADNQFFIIQTWREGLERTKGVSYLIMQSLSFHARSYKYSYPWLDSAVTPDHPLEGVRFETELFAFEVSFKIYFLKLSRKFRCLYFCCYCWIRFRSVIIWVLGWREVTTKNTPFRQLVSLNSQIAPCVSCGASPCLCRYGDRKRVIHL